jgi:hypothetical protein
LSTRQYYYHHDKKNENLEISFKEASSISSSGLSTADVLRCISDEKALSLFKAIAVSQNWSRSILMTKLRLTRKQYYSRMQKLLCAGLIIKRVDDSKYHFTSLGKIIFDIYGKIETAIKYYWKLKAIDSIMMMSVEGKKLPAHQCQRIIDTLIHNQEIKDIILIL